MALNPATLIELPEQLRGYKLLERLGRGGFGEVWKVEAPGGFLKAMKFVFGNLESLEGEDGQQAEQELKALHRVKSIRHPYILSLERFDIIHGQLIIVMELADRNLWDRFRECRLLGMPGIPRDELLNYLTEAAEALDLMNKHYQIQHLDIKPQNLFLVFDHIKVADFGLAKAFEGMKATVTGGVTPVYAAPETFEGYVSRYSDQYSLAIVFQELLTGVRPFNGQNTKQLLMQHLRDAPDLKSLPAHDRDIIARGLSKTPHERWPSCMEMMLALRQAPSLGPAEDADLAALPLPNLAALTGAAQTPRPGSPVGNTLPMRAAEFPPDPHTIQAQALRSERISTLSPTRTPLRDPSVSPNLPAGAMPTLVTPKLVTPRAGGSGGPAAPAMTLQRQQIIETGRMGALGIAPPEKQGDGVLFPAIIIGLGAAGAAVLRHFRGIVHDTFGKWLPSFKLAYIDTDPDALSAALAGHGGFDVSEVIPARLNRPGHYLQRDGLPAVDTWLPQGLLYQLPKNPGPANGVRAFGRLALIDNYRTIVQRLRQLIEPFLSDDPLTPTAKETGLGIRSNRPRVYIVAGVAGGTGGGMFLDLAYLMKHELRQVGYKSPETIGYLLVPPHDPKHQPKLAQANTFAALAELGHYASGEGYQTRFDTAEAPITDGTGPFTRAAVIELPKRQDPATNARCVGMAARSLYLEMLSPVGKTTDNVREVAPVDAYAGPTVQSFGLYRLSWPRPEILASLTRRFCQQLLHRWTQKESTHLREPIQSWLTDLWNRSKLGTEALLNRFQDEIKKSLREAPEKVFEAVIEGLRTRSPSAGRMDAMAAVGALEQIIKLVGKPEGAGEGEVVPAISQAMVEISKSIVAETENQLASVAVSFLEQPQYRLAGAEEAFNQITARLKQSIETLEALRETVGKETVETYARMFPLIGGLNASGGFSALVTRKGAITAELLDLMTLYPRSRYRLLLLDAGLTLYRGLLSSVPDYLRDVAFCRTRLETFAQSIASVGPTNLSAEPSAFILPVGCGTLVEAADRFIAALPPEDILSFDQEIQNMLNKRYRGLTNICLKQERGASFPTLLQDAARAFLDARLEHADPATALSRFRGEGEATLEVLTKAFDEALPAITLVNKPQLVEGTILAVPEGEPGQKLQSLATEANPGIEFIPAKLANEVVILREYPRVPLSVIAHLGGSGHDAYQQQLQTAASPHSRVDITWRAPIAVAK